VSDDHGRPEVHLRMLVPDDARWVVDVDRATATPLARAHGWDAEKLEAELAEGIWASDDRWGWAIVVDGDPCGFALVTDLASGDAGMSIRIARSYRGRGVGREVLRQLADHHFQAHPELHRLTGRAHEQNIPMQRAFNAAGFRMEARYRESYLQPDGGYASEWGYALIRADWEDGRHRADAMGYDLHGLVFEVEEVTHGPETPHLLLRFLQEGKRAIARYDADHVSEGELAGILDDDVLRYHFVHVEEQRSGPATVTGNGRARLQRRGDARLELVDDWSTDAGASGRRVLIERHEAP
jgi:RimJ/RimL family protein N-acetyltransferase